MDVRDVRLRNLHQILNARFGGVIAKFARAIGKDPNQTRFILYPDKPGGRRIGEKLARAIESRLNLLPGALDINIETGSSSEKESRSFAGLPGTGGIRLEIGKRLRVARERVGLTPQQVCDAVPGLDHSRYEHYENGYHEPDVETAKRIAALMRVSAAWLLTLTDESPDPREADVVEAFRQSDARGKETIWRVAELESSYAVPAGTRPPGADREK